MIGILLSVLMLAQTEVEPNSAQLSMAQADIAFRTGNFVLAKKHILSALSSGDLNDVGTTILYWNLHYCDVALGDSEDAADAIFSFIAHARNVDNKKFIEEYELDLKLVQAKVMLEVYWARKNNTSCRSKDFACPIETKKFDGIKLFGSMLPFCGGTKFIVGIDFKKDNQFITTHVKCANKGTETYYFYNER